MQEMKKRVIYNDRKQTHASFIMHKRPDDKRKKKTIYTGVGDAG